MNELLSNLKSCTGPTFIHLIVDFDFTSLTMTSPWPISIYGSQSQTHSTPPKRTSRTKRPIDNPPTKRALDCLACKKREREKGVFQTLIYTLCSQVCRGRKFCRNAKERQKNKHAHHFTTEMTPSSTVACVRKVTISAPTHTPATWASMNGSNGPCWSRSRGDAFEKGVEYGILGGDKFLSQTSQGAKSQRRWPPMRATEVTREVKIVCGIGALD